MAERDDFSWNVILSAYCRRRRIHEAFDLFCRMRDEKHGIWLSSSAAFASMAALAGKLEALQFGAQIHAGAVKNRCVTDVFVGNALVDMYSKCGRISDAQRVFDSMPQRDAVSWNSMISGYAQNGHTNEALELFWMMPERTVVSWTAIIAGCAQNGYEDDALKIFWQMREDATRIHINANTFASVIPACKNLEMGQPIHGEAIRSGFEGNIFVCNALIDMYSKLGSAKDAFKVFNGMSSRDIVSWTVMIAGYNKNGCVEEAKRLFCKMAERNAISWTAMISGYAQNGYCREAMGLFQQMCSSEIAPNSTVYACLLSVCAQSAALEEGMEIHGDALRKGFIMELDVANAIVDMYAKCGNLEKARNAFDKMVIRDIFSWTVMIGGYAANGSGEEAINTFNQMQLSGVTPDNVTFLCVLIACCHSGLVDEALKYLNQMTGKYGISPSIEHYGCIIDLLGRAGHLDAAQEIVKRMPLAPNVEVLGSLLRASCMHKNFELGVSVAKLILQLDPGNVAAYKVLCNIYAEKGVWQEKQNLHEFMEHLDASSNQGCSWINIERQFYVFDAADNFTLNVSSSNLAKLRNEDSLEDQCFSQGAV